MKRAGTQQIFFLAAALLLIPAVAFCSEQAGPNPANLSPAGTPQVSQFTGAFTYSYPIAVPPGRRGMQPNLTLLYNSQAQNGWVGLGWNLSLGSIQRSTKNGIPTYNDSQDTFVLQLQGATQQLVSIDTGTDGTGSFTEYRAQIESAFSRIRYYASPPASSSLWVVTTKNGNQYQFGGLGQNTTNSQFFYWGLTKAFDPLGNFMQVSYPNLSSATASGVPGPGGTPTAIYSTGAVVGFMPASISYTGKCTAGTCQTITQTPLNQITFSYELRPDTMTTAIVGGEQVLVTRLKTIQTASNGNAVKTYQLAYSTNALGNSLLTGISLAGTNGAILTTTTFGYQSGANYTVSLSTAYQLPVDITLASLVDVNGDGLPDIVQYISGSSSAAWINTGYGWVSSSTWFPPTAILGSSYQDQGVRFADINGDGLTDILQRYDNGSGGNVSYAWLNSGSGWNTAPTQWKSPVSFVESNNLPTGSAFVDVNGDGLPDLVQYYHTHDQIFPYQHDYSGNWLNSGNGWGPAISTWVPPQALDFIDYTYPGFPEQDRGVRFADLDGDGLVDVIQGGGVSVASGTWLNTGGGWTSPQAQWQPPAAFVTLSGSFSQDTGLRLVDINGDGLSDLVQYSSNPVIFHIWLNTGHGWLQNDSFAPSVSNISTNGHLEFADLNGDGVPDIIALSTNPASDRVYLGQSTPSFVLTTINNGIGGATQISYGFSPPPAQPGMHLPPVTVTQSVTTTDGMPGTTPITSSYTFSGGLFAINRPNREFLGFRVVARVDGQGNTSVSHYLQNDGSMSGVNLYKGTLSEQDNYDPAGNLLAQSTYTVSYSTPFSGVYFPFASEVDSYIGNKHSAVKYAYDSFGNLTQEQDLGDVSVIGDERTIATTYSGNASAYLVGYPLSKQTFSGLGTTGSLLADTSFFYDSTFTQNPTFGLLTKTDQWLSGGQDPISTSAYDNYGNLTDTYDPLFNATAGGQGNHARTIYEATFNQFPSSVQQGVGSALNLPTETFTYDPGSGQILTHVDVNGSTTTYSYDVFGRLSSVVGPADQVTASSPTITYQYNLSTTPPLSIFASARAVHGSSLTLVSYSYFDGLGRAIETKTAGPVNTQIITGAVSFNSLGQAATSYIAMSRAASTSYVVPASTLPFSLTTYDGLGRVAQVVNPDNTVSTRAYQGWKETDTDANGHAKVYVHDAYGRLVEVDELYSTSTFITTYQYDLLGDLTGIVNALGQGTTIYYDTLSRKTKMADPQMGTWRYQYDPNGNLLQQTDAKNQVIAMSYDAISRRTFKIYPDSTTISYVYDSGPFAIGKLSQVTDLSGAESYSYDREGNILTTTRTIAGKVYVTSTTYDALGRQTSLVYPDSSTIKNVYDGTLLSYVQSGDGSLTYASLSYSTSAPAKIGNIAYGNGMNAQYSYDPNMFRLTTLKTLTSGGPVQFLSYGYDNVGNISQITDSTGPMTQTFTYDPLDRLSQASGPYGAHAYTYDPVGNFLVNSDNARGFWGFDDTSVITSIQGVVVATPARVGNGLLFAGNNQAIINGSQYASPPATLTISLWLRPKALGSGYAVVKSTSFYFPQIESNGSLDAKLELSSGEQLVHVSSGALFNLWSYYALTYDGSNISIFVNGQLWKVQAATGTILTSTQPIVLGSNFAGLIDELYVEPLALSASQILQRYSLYPQLGQSQPFAPASVPAGMTAGVVNSTYTFGFTAWDLNGNSLKYRIDWGNGGATQDTAYVPSGTTVQSTFCFTSLGQYNLRVRSVEPAPGGGEVLSAWSPTYNVLITSPALSTALAQPILIGASGNVGKLSGSARLAADTAGEALTGLSNSSLNIGTFGYQGSSVAVSAWTPQYLGSQGAGGTDAPPAPVLPVNNLLTVQYSTAAVDISTIALNVLEHGATVLMDANGNMQVANGRWTLFDFDNRPVRIVTPDATLAQFTYDYHGGRTQQTVTPLSQSSQTTSYVGEVFEATPSTSTLKYVAAGPIRVAMVDSAGTTTYFLSDHLGSTNFLVNGVQTSIRTSRYIPFGSLFQTGGTIDNDHKYTGKRLDAATGLYYYGARYYDPLAGRFISPDSQIQTRENPQALNRYAYSWNNPVRLLDNDGHSVLTAAAYRTMLYLGGGTPGSLDVTAAARGAIRGSIDASAFSLGLESGGLSGGLGLGLATDRALVGGGIPQIYAAFGAGWALGSGVNLASGIAGWLGANYLASNTSSIASALPGLQAAGAIPDTQMVSAGSIRNVNEYKNIDLSLAEMNCVNCAIAADATLAGNSASAMPSAIAQDLKNLTNIYGGEFQPVSGQMQIGSLLNGAGNGSRGIVFGELPGEDFGHVFNAVNKNGEIQFIDGQLGTGGNLNFNNLQNFRFLFTNPAQGSPDQPVSPPWKEDF